MLVVDIYPKTKLQKRGRAFTIAIITMNTPIATHAEILAVSQIPRPLTPALEKKKTASDKRNENPSTTFYFSIY